MPQTPPRFGKNDECGVSLLLVVGSLTLLLGIAALAIDLASLYVARNEAQRVADAAALAGARVFADSGCVGSGTCSSIESQASRQAIVLAGQDFIGGQTTVVTSADIGFDVSNSQNPRMTVTVVRSAARGNPLPTFFGKALGFGSADISATATAEAFNPSGGGPPICTSCVRPWAIGNCDPVHLAPRNTFCAAGGYFLDPTQNFAIAHPGSFPAGVIGEGLNVRASSEPSQFGSVDYGGGTEGYTDAIIACPAVPFTCGNTIDTLPGSRGVPTAEAVEDLIHARGSGLGQGQDSIDTTISPPQIHAGSNNPLVQSGVVAAGSVISTSNSLVTVFIYDGHILDPGKQSITIVGFAEVFLTQVDANNDVPAVILNLVGCGGNPQPGGTCDSNGGGGAVSGGGAELIPVRLIRSP